MRNDDARQGQTERQSDHSAPQYGEAQALESRLRWAQESQALAVRILNLLNQEMTGKDAIRRVLVMVQEFTGFEAVAIRLREGDDFPYFVTKGFPDNFVEAERYLCDHDEAGAINRDADGNPVLECMCGNILCGQTDPSYSFFTEGGSFWSCHTTELLATTTDADRQTRTRNRCNSAGYESVALIPLRSDGEMIGLLQLNDSRKDCFTPDMITFFEGIGASVGIVLARMRTEEALRKSREELQTMVVERTEELWKANEQLRLELAERKKAEDALRESERKYRDLIEGAPVGIFQSTFDGKVLGVNPAYARMFGYASAEEAALEIDNVAERIYVEPERRKMLLKLALSKDGFVKAENRYRKKDGSLFWGQLYFRVIRDCDGEPKHLEGFVEDITERKESQEELRENEERYRAVFNNSAVGISVSDRNGKIINVNPALLRTLGYTKQELESAQFADITHPDDVEMSRNKFDALVRGEIESYRIEKRYIRKDGEIVWVDLSVAAILDEKGVCVATFGMTVDITERRQAEKQIKQAKEFLNTVVNNLPIAVFAKSAQEGQFILWNDASEALFGFTRDQVIGKTDYDFFPKEQADFFWEKDRESFGSRDIIDIPEEPILTKNLGTRTLHTRKVPVYDKDSRPSCLLAISEDITERKQAEEALIREKSFSDAIIDVLPGTFYLFDEQLNMLKWNRNLEQMAQDLGQEISSMSPLNFFVGEDRSRVEEAVRRGFSVGETSVEATVNLGNGKVTPYLFTAKRVVIDGKNLLMGVGIDISDRVRVEKALRESEGQKQAILDGITTNIAFVNEDLEIKWVNKTAADSVGKLPSQMIGHRCHEFWADPDKPCDGCATVKAFETKKSEHTTIVTPDGRVWDEKGEPVFDDAGRLLGVVEIAQDITDRKRAGDALRESEDRYRDLVENIQDLICTHDLQGNLLFVNEAPAKVLGYSSADLIGTNLRSYLAPEVRHEFDEYLATIQSDGHARGLMLVQTKSGDKRLWEYRNTLRTEGPSGPIVRGLARDITDRKNAEEALRQSEEKFSKAFHASPDVLIISHRDTGRIIETNEKWESTFGYTREEAIGRTALELGLLENPEVRSNAILKLRRQGFVRDYEVNIRRKSGEIRQTLLSAESIEIRGEPCILSVVHDITERKRAEEALRASEAQLSNAVVMAHLGRWEYDVAEDLFTFNDQFYKIFRTTAEEVGGYTMSSADYAHRFVHSDDMLAIANEIRKSIEATDPDFSQQLDHRIVYADGEIGHISVRIFLVKDELGRTVKTYGVNQDITDRKRAEEKNAQLAAIVESSDDAIIGKSLDGTITSWNKAAEKMYGYKDTEIVGKPISLLAPPHRQNEIPQLLDRIKQGEHVEHYETLRRRRDGRDIDVSLTISPIRNVDGRIIGASAIARDITEQRNLQRQLLQSQKMEAVGILAGGIAHDFNNLLTVIQGFSELLLLETDEKAPGYADLLKIRESALRGAELIRNLLAFSRKAESKPRPINLNREVTRIENLLSRTIPKMIKIDLHLEGDLAAVNADPDQVGQVLMNLAVNAEQAMPDGGALNIATANISLDDGYCRAHPEIHPGAYVLLTVSDTGQGMEKETLEHIFDPFFTTKGVGKGTGLGLAMVYGIVRQHGGLITCESEPNEGATFKIYLPAIEEARTEKEAEEEQALPSGGTETILLVDDEDFVRDLGTKFLTRAGYTVLTAASGPEAVRLYLKEAEKISLVILDLIMPEMGGDKCLEEIVAINPNANILISSGAAVEGKKKETVESGARGFVNKPFRLRDMLKTVREVLDSA